MSKYKLVGNIEEYKIFQVSKPIGSQTTLGNSA